MRATGVVVQSPIFDDLAGFFQRKELVLVQAFVAEATVEALDICVLRRLPRRDMEQANTAIGGPSEHRQARKFRTIVHDDRFRISAHAADRIENSRHARSRKRCVDFDRKAFPTTIIHDRERANSPS